jgi:hypothetical protein
VPVDRVGQILCPNGNGVVVNEVRYIMRHHNVGIPGLCGRTERNEIRDIAPFACSRESSTYKIYFKGCWK